MSDSNKLNDYSDLKARIFAGDNRAGYVERERMLDELGDCEDVPVGFRFSHVLEAMLRNVSTPVDENDVFLGCVVEERLGEGKSWQSKPFFRTNGHMTLDWETLLRDGLSGIAEKAKTNSIRIDSEQAKRFAENVERCCVAVKTFCERYAVAGEKVVERISGKTDQMCLGRATSSLKIAPWKPAVDFFSALQAIWIVHMISSCYVGARDFGFGRMDQYLLPLFRKSIQDGMTIGDARMMLARFFLKTNEITGTATWNHEPKPIPCNATKQYLIIGGVDAEGRDQFNELSELMLEAAELIRMPEPVMTVRLSRNTPGAVWTRVGEACGRLNSQIHFFNDDVVSSELTRHGVEEEDAFDYGAVGCCRTEIPGRMDDSFMKTYHYHNVADWMMRALRMAVERACGSFDEVLECFKKISLEEMRKSVLSAGAFLERGYEEPYFHFESMFLRDCVENCADLCADGVRYRGNGHFWGGIATVIDSLYAVRRLVFEEREFGLRELMDIVSNEYRGHEKIRRRLSRDFPKFGNDNAEVDELAKVVGGILVDNFDSIKLPSNQIGLQGFYSLDQHHRFGRELGATPDGRLAGEPISENQSPAYGRDVNGVTALLKSVAKLPLNRTTMGGLNLQFAQTFGADKIADTIRTYFQLGGMHVGFTFVSKRELEEARTHPEKYRSLCVRMYGFSEFFVSLSRDEQIELINRTGY